MIATAAAMARAPERVPCSRCEQVHSGACLVYRIVRPGHKPRFFSAVEDVLRIGKQLWDAYGMRVTIEVSGDSGRSWKPFLAYRMEIFGEARPLDLEFPAPARDIHPIREGSD